MSIGADGRWRSTHVQGDLVWLAYIYVVGLSFNWDEHSIVGVGPT